MLSEKKENNMIITLNLGKFNGCYLDNKTFEWNMLEKTLTNIIWKKERKQYDN